MRDLASTGDACVVGHGDFHPRHLVLTPDDRLFVVDWISMSLVTPWVELAHLLRWLSPAHHAAVTADYLEAMQRQGLLREVSPARAASLAASALLYDRLIVAKHRVRKLAEPGPAGTSRRSARVSTRWRRPAIEVLEAIGGKRAGGARRGARRRGARRRAPSR